MLNFSNLLQNKVAGSIYQKLLPIFGIFFKSGKKVLQNRKSKKTAFSLLVLGAGLLLIVTLVVTLFLITGRVFVELFGWLFFPFPKRIFKKKTEIIIDSSSS